MEVSADYKTLKRNFGTVLLDKEIYYRVYGTEKPRPYHKFKKISNLCLCNGGLRCNFAARRRHSKLRSVARLLLNPKKKEIIDHKNRNPLDNRIHNLRKVNIRQNNLNRTCRNNTGFYGVCCCRRNKFAYLKAYFKNASGKVMLFSLTDTPNNRIVAAFARDKFVLLSGDEEYAPLNFPCFKYEPFKTILLKENLNVYKERP